MHKQHVVWILLAIWMTQGCGSEKKPEAQPPAQSDPRATLAGTQWQLAEIQSMSDEVGTQTVDDPSEYTLSFGADGEAQFRLDCNRGHGIWTAEPSSANGGSLRFGPLAVTRALCPPPSMDERVARDMDFVRSYTLKNGRLFLSLMADGGIYVWAPLTESP